VTAPLDESLSERRQFIMILNGHGPKLAPIASMFVDTALGPGDRMAVYLNHPVSNAFVEQQPFTASKPLLRMAIRTIEPAFRPFQPTPFRNLNAREQAEWRRLMELEKFEMRQNPGDNNRWVVVDLTLAPMARADYVVEVAQGDAVRLTPFRLVP
jgi:hypothetical protein